MALSRPMVYGSLAILALGLFWWSNQEDAPTAPVLSAKHNDFKGPDQTLDLKPEDFSAKFVAPKRQTRNLFVPLVTISNQIVVPGPTPSKNIIRIPEKLAGGDPNWIFTGFAIVDGAREALFENTTAHLGTYVRQGALWKNARLVNVASDSVTLTDEHGAKQIVLRYDPQLEAKAKTKDQPSVQAPGQNPVPGPPDAGTQPMQIPRGFRGRIGPNIQISPLPPAMAASGD